MSKPLTITQALALREHDKIKYIGPRVGPLTGISDYRGRLTLYNILQRRPFTVKFIDGPSVDGNITIYRHGGCSVLKEVKPELFELVKHRAEEFEQRCANVLKKSLPAQLDYFLQNVKSTAETYKSHFDRSVGKLPLHLKIEVLGSLSDRHKKILDLLNSDLPELLLRGEDASK